MNVLDFTSYYIVIPLLVLTILVFVHEWGHFWVARKNKVRVEVFSVGFGPELFGWTDSYGTRWKFSAIPLGGYVKMFGEMDVKDKKADSAIKMTPEEKSVAFCFKSLGQRAAIVVAGPAVNFIFAIIAFAILAVSTGTPVPLAGIGKVFSNSAAEKAGFLPGDRVVSINKQPIKYFEQLRNIVQRDGEKYLSFLVERNNKIILIKAKPQIRVQKNAANETQASYILGVSWDPDYTEYEKHNPIVALWIGVERTWALSIKILEYIGDIFFANQSTDDLGGPLRIAKISGDMAQKGLEDVILLMAVLSVNLGLINLFPIPMLDGGHLLFYAIEGIMRRPLGEKIQEYSFRFGLLLILTLFIFVSWNDIVNF